MSLFQSVVAWLRKPMKRPGRWGLAIMLSPVLLPVAAYALDFSDAVQARVALAALGLMCVGIGIVRPKGWLHVDGWFDLDSLLGDRGTVIFYLLIGLGIVVVACVLPLRSAATGT